MKKIFKELAMLVGVVSVSWWLGGMMYFIMVTKHHREKEKIEDAIQNIKSYVGGPMPSKPNARTIPRPTDERNFKTGRSNIKYYNEHFGRDISGIRPRKDI